MVALRRKANRTPAEDKPRRGSGALRLILDRWRISTVVASRRVPHRRVSHSLLAFVLLVNMLPPAAAAASTEKTAAAESSAIAQKAAVVARVGDTIIRRDEFDQALDIAARRKFYHGKTPDPEMAELQREVARTLVDDVLLLKEARNRGLKPDAESIKRTLGEYETRYRSSEQWQTRRAAMLPKLQKQLETDSLLQQLQAGVRNVAQPDAAQLQVFYAANLAKFTEPERSRVSTILLKVDPSAPRQVWDAARGDAADLVKKLRGGANFAQLARQRSGDESVVNGGDMGYLHRGMLAEPAQLVVDRLKLTEISDPVTLLQGVAIFRLDERKAAVQNPLAKVEARARELWRREQGDRAWQALLDGLRKATPAVIDESGFLPMVSSATVVKPPVKAK